MSLSQEQSAVTELCAFLDGTVQPNMQSALENPSDARAATNAVLTIDGLAGALFWVLKDTGHPQVRGCESDNTFRDALASENHHFRVLRDLAASYKHGRLTQPKTKQPRLVLSPSHVASVRNQCGLFQCGDRLGGNILMITLADGSWRRASNVISACYRFLVPIAEGLETTHLTAGLESRLVEPRTACAASVPPGIPAPRGVAEAIAGTHSPAPPARRPGSRRDRAHSPDQGTLK